MAGRLQEISIDDGGGLRRADRYSLDAADCAAVLAEELEEGGPASTLRLLRVWGWLDRCAALGLDPGVGVERLLASEGASLVSRPLALGRETRVFSSEPREAVRRLCGWASLTEEGQLAQLVEGLELAGEADRAAALALWHGDLLLSLRVMQRSMRQGGDGDGSPYEQDSAYAQVLALVVACVSGFCSGQAADELIVQAWRASAVTVARQLRQFAVGASCMRSNGAQYLLALVGFLTAIATGEGEGGTAQVLENEELAVEDRVGFAATYLGDEELAQFIANLVTDSEAQGDLEGLLLRGLGPPGVPLLQSYLDRSDDLQTVALLSGHMTKVERNSEPAQWLQQYRMLLNQREQYLDRANLDVQLGRKHRLRSGGLPCDYSSKTVSMRRDIYRQHPFSEAPHIFLRCHFCSASLPADASQKQQQAAWQKKQGSILHCCSNCKKGES